MQSMLLNLPIEIIELIVAHVYSKKDRRALWRVSSVFHEVCMARVFETLTIRAKDNNLTRLDRRPYASLDAIPPLRCLKLVGHIHLRAPFHENLHRGERCPHESLDLPFYPDPVPPGFSMLGPQLIPLFVRLQEQCLVSFSWDLGMCIPTNILGSEGYLTKKQTTLESLSLITGVYCVFWPSNATPLDPVVLSGFPHLRHFSWKGLVALADFDSLRGLFRSNFRVLESLELDFIAWGYDWNDSNTNLPFSNFILPRQSDGVVHQFKHLKSLALSAYEFEPTTDEIIGAFNVEDLQTLKLHNCRGIHTFLSTIVNTGLILRLKSLELIIEDEEVEHDGSLESFLIRFLQSFEGLEHLHLMHRARWAPLQWLSHYWNAILHHRSTLKRLVYHERVKTMFLGPLFCGSRLQEHWVDNTRYHCDFPLPWEEKIRIYEDDLYNSALAQMQLEYFGIADNPEIVSYVIKSPWAKEQSFKLLHFRRTGTDPLRPDIHGDKPTYEEEIRDLIQRDPGSWSPDDYSQYMAGTQWNSVFNIAQGIFESPKFENLRILAYGDFSHRGRYKGRHLLLCRAATPNPEVRFRVMSRDDIDFYKRSGLLSLDFLSACPRECLFSDSRHTFP